MNKFLSVTDLVYLDDIYYISGLWQDIVKIRCLNGQQVYYLNRNELEDFAKENVIVPTSKDYTTFSTFSSAKNLKYLRGVVDYPSNDEDNDFVELITLGDCIKNFGDNPKINRLLGEFIPNSVERYFSAYNNGSIRDFNTILTHPRGIVVGQTDINYLVAYCGAGNFTFGNQANLRAGKFKFCSDSDYSLSDYNFKEIDNLNVEFELLLGDLGYRFNDLFLVKKNFINIKLDEQTWGNYYILSKNLYEEIFTMSEFKPKIYTGVVEPNLLFDYCGTVCSCMQLSNSIVLLKNSIVAETKYPAILEPFNWIYDARNNFLDSENRLTCNLEFDSRNRLAMFAYCNTVRSTVAFKAFNSRNNINVLSNCEKVKVDYISNLLFDTFFEKLSISKDVLSDILNPICENDTIKIIRRYEDSFNYYNKDNIDSLFSLSNSMKVLYEKLYNFLTLVSYRQPIYLLGEAGVGKNVLEEQIIKGIAEKYGAFVASFDFDTSTTQANTTMSTSPLTDNEIYGIYVEAIIKANEEYFASSTEDERKAKLSSDLEALKNNTYEPSCNQIIVLGNEFSRQRGDTLAKLLSFLSNRGAEINIGGKIYYNTPNLLLFFNGNTVVEGRVVGGNILSDKAWGSRLYMYEMTGIFYLNPKTHKVMTDIYESLKDDETLSEEFKVKLAAVYNKLTDIGLDTTYGSESKKNLPADCKINMREVFNALAVDSLAESCGF